MTITIIAMRRTKWLKTEKRAEYGKKKKLRNISGVIVL